MNRLLRKKLNFSQFLQRQPLREIIIKVKEFKEEKNPECLLERVLKSLSILNPTQREKTKAISAKLEKLKMYQSMKTEWFKLGMELHQSLQHDSFMFCSKEKQLPVPDYKQLFEKLRLTPQLPVACKLCNNRDDETNHEVHSRYR